ncbi:MAG: four helix bundle protein [Muribaculaceae bacterium]|nr:four helix bundle protein [Muribaculaceae bacterium]
MQKYSNLDIWKKSYSLALQIYGITKDFPNDEKFGLTSQLRRAAVSIPTNIAEGAGRATTKDFANFIQIAIGSSNEVECELMLSKDLGYVGEDIFKTLFDQVREIKIMMIYFRRTLLK